MIDEQGLKLLGQSEVFSDPSALLEMQRLKKRLSGADTPEAKRKALWEACQGFESMFLLKLWETMRATIPKDGDLHSEEEDYYLSMFDQEISKKMAEGDGVGLAKMMFEQMKSQLEGEKNVKTAMSDASGATAKGFQTDSARSPNLDDPEQLNGFVNRLASKIEARDHLLSKRSGVESISGGDEKVSPLIWPVDGQVSSPFGWRMDPLNGERDWHPGVDLAASTGTKIKSCWPGEVVFSGQLGGYGQAVIVEHPNGWRSLYGHTSENFVVVGDRVQAGEPVAAVGNSGRSTGPHLHFELRRPDGALNPIKLQQRLLAESGSRRRLG